MTSSDHRKNRVHSSSSKTLMNGEVIVVRSDLAQTFDKSQTARVNQAIEKVEQMALKEP